MTIKHTAKQLALRAGIELRRFNVAESSDARLLHQLAQHGIDLVLDVGANDGGYGRMLREGGYAGEILSFEPLSQAHAALVRTVAADPAWHVAPRMALGDSNGKTAIHIAGNSTSSSVLPMGPLHAAAAPASCYQGQEEVPLQRLDSVAHACLRGGRTTLLKVDTQGYEMPVLRGAARLWPQIRGVQVELSVVELYDGQALYLEVIDFLRGLGFELWNLSPGFVDPRSGRLLQFDGTFYRP